MKRTYAIKFTNDNGEEFYIKELLKYELGYRFYHTKKINDAEIWKNKKSIEKVVKKLNQGIFEPGFDKSINSSFTYEVIETTPIKILRLLKLKKIIKKNKPI